MIMGSTIPGLANSTMGKYQPGITENSFTLIPPERSNILNLVDSPRNLIDKPPACAIFKICEAA
jgi:hypothetical protein